MYLVPLAIAAMIALKPEPIMSEYLFERYLMAPKWDKTGYFGHKDPIAAEMMGMPLDSYVIGGLDERLKDALYAAFRAMDAEGITGCITSGYRDEKRQAMITEGVRASVNGSYHGGAPTRRGWGHGLAVDIIGCQGTTSNQVWRWFDKNGKTHGLIRPYPHDPPHVIPWNSSERFARKRSKTKKQHVARKRVKKKSTRVATR